MTTRQQGHPERLIAQHRSVAPKLFLNDWTFWEVDGEAVRSCPEQRVLQEKVLDGQLWKSSANGTPAGPVSELRMAFRFSWQEACEWIGSRSHYRVAH